MLAQRFPQGNGRALVEQDTHSSGSQRTPRCMFEHGANLFRRDAGKPLHELGNLRAILEVFEQRGNGHARAAEHPGSAYPLGVPFDGGASRPIDHETNGTTSTLWRLAPRHTGAPRAARPCVAKCQTTMTCSRLAIEKTA